MIGVHEIIRTWICAMGFTPIVVHSYQATIKDDGQRVGLIYWHNVHYPQLLHYECSCKSAFIPITRKHIIWDSTLFLSLSLSFSLSLSHSLMALLSPPKDQRCFWETQLHYQWGLSLRLSQQFLADFKIKSKEDRCRVQKNNGRVVLFYPP